MQNFVEVGENDVVGGSVHASNLALLADFTRLIILKNFTDALLEPNLVAHVSSTEKNLDISESFMTWQMIFVFALLAATFVLMLWEKFSLDIVALMAFSVLLVTGILTPAEAFTVFSNEAVITVACMFILSAALERTGVIENIGHKLNRLVGKSEWSLLLVTLPIVAVLSAFINHTPVVVVFMPIMISLAATRGLKPSKLLIPLSFMSVLGGTCTLIGSSSNILVSSNAQQLGQPPLGMFELTKIGVPISLLGLAYLLTIGRKLLPARETLASMQTTDSKQYLTELVIVADSPLIGKHLTETSLANHPKARVLEIIRDGDTLTTPLNKIVLKKDDHLRISTALSSVMDINSLAGVEILPKAKPGLDVISSEKAVVAECVIAPHSSLHRRSIREINFRRRYGVLVLAVHRKGVNLRAEFADVKLKSGDTLLVEGPESTLRELRDNRDFLLLLDVPHTPKRWPKQWMAIAAIAMVVILATLKILPIAALAIIAAVAVIALRCVDVEEAYRAVEWKILFMVFGMLALGLALEKTHGAEFIARGLLSSFGSLGPTVVLSIVILLAAVLANFLSHNVAAVLLTPIALQSALALHVSPRPFIIAIAIGASACFATPIGYQTNLLVYGPGGYFFRDFIKIGLPLNVLIWILATLLIPWLWPFKL
jgi:di/tricarboxylate transporter